MVKSENFKKVEVTSSEELRSWLENNYTQSESVWLVTYKKTEIGKYLSTSDILDELISYGWIDGIRRKLDESKTMQLVSPRKVEHWAQSYKDRAAKLIKEGRMHPAGLKAIELSKQNGLWDFMDDVDKLIVPEDLQYALDNCDGASEFFHNINNSSKRFVLRYIKIAKTDQTRASRIKQIALLSAEGKKLKGS
jgi:uncharacterized protein YdeI (YjbR/CyaY-like superfamily)